MKFSVLAITTVPDTDLGRRLHNLDNLNDKDVAKILFHRRKQESGNTEELRLVQQRITALSYITFQNKRVAQKSHTVPECSERVALDDAFGAIKGSGPMVTWHGTDDAVLVLRLRAMRLNLRAASFWRQHDQPASHVDLARVLQPPGRYSNTDLDELAVSMALPGLLGLEKLDAWQARLAGDFQSLRAQCELAALNVYLLAVRYWYISGACTRSDMSAAQRALRQQLASREAPHVRGFLDTWSDS